MEHIVLTQKHRQLLVTHLATLAGDVVEQNMEHVEDELYTDGPGGMCDWHALNEHLAVLLGSMRGGRLRFTKKEYLDALTSYDTEWRETVLWLFLVTVKKRIGHCRKQQQYQVEGGVTHGQWVDEESECITLFQWIESETMAYGYAGKW